MVDCAATVLFRIKGALSRGGKERREEEHGARNVQWMWRGKKRSAKSPAQYDNVY